MGVYWLMNMAKNHNGKVEVVDLKKNIYPIDEELVFNRVNTHGKCLVLTEEPFQSSFVSQLCLEVFKKNVLRIWTHLFM